VRMREKEIDRVLYGKVNEDDKVERERETEG
jgi:hypothetical protein